MENILCRRRLRLDHYTQDSERVAQTLVIITIAFSIEVA